MRHRKSIKKLGRTVSHRKSMISNMMASLFTHKRIKTTVSKAKSTRRFADRMITFAKRGDVHARRHVLKYVRDKKAVNILFNEIAQLNEDRNGGYTRIVKLDRRVGDGAQMSILELVGYETLQTDKTEDKKSQTEKPAKNVKEKDESTISGEKSE